MKQKLKKILKCINDNWPPVVLGLALLSIVAMAIVFPIMCCSSCSNEEPTIYYDENYVLERDAGDSDYFYNQLTANQQKAYKMIHKAYLTVKDEDIKEERAFCKLYAKDYNITLLQLGISFFAFKYDCP
jgi:hypothetical protein